MADRILNKVLDIITLYVLTKNSSWGPNEDDVPESLLFITSEEGRQNWTKSSEVNVHDNSVVIIKNKVPI